MPSPPPRRAPTSNRLLLTLYSASSAGLVVDGGSIEGDPGAQLPDLVFADNLGRPGTYVWAFAPGVQLLDRACRPISQADAVALANAPGANAMIVVDYLGANGRAVAPAKVQLWARASGGVADCQSETTP